MRAVVQKVSNAAVMVGNKEISRIDAGLLVFLAVHVDDGLDKAIKIGEKLIKLRIFPDREQKMNLSLQDTGGSLLLVSQFTLYGDASSGNRPSFIKAARPERAEIIFLAVADYLQKQGITVALGAFGQHMSVSLLNDGPTTIIMDL